MNRSRAATTATLALLVALRVAHGSAQTFPTMAYEAPGTCPEVHELDARLAEALRSAPAGSLPPIEPSVTITTEGTVYTALVVLREGTYEDRRTLSDVDCAVLADAALLVIAIALVPGLDPVVLERTPHPRPPTERTTETARPVPDAPRGSLWLAAHASYGVLPGVAVGGELGGSFALGSLRLDAAVRGLPLVGARFGGTPLLGGDVAQLVGLVRARGSATVLENLELAAGGGLEAGAVLGRGVGISDPRDAIAPWVAIEAVVGLTWVPHPVIAFFLEIEALVPFVRPVFSIAGVGVLYRPEPVCGALRLGFALRVP